MLFFVRYTNQVLCNECDLVQHHENLWKKGGTTSCNISDIPLVCNNTVTTQNGVFFFFLNTHGSVHHDSVLIKVQHDATVCRQFILCHVTLHVSGVMHPSSGVLKTVSATSGVRHGNGTVTSFLRGLIRTFRQTFYFKVPNLTSEIRFFGTVLQYPFRWPHTISKGNIAAGFHCCKEMFKYVPLKTENQRRLSNR